MDGNALIIGQANTGTNQTELSTSRDALGVISRTGVAVFCNTRGGEGSAGLASVNDGFGFSDGASAVSGFLVAQGVAAIRGEAGDAPGCLGASDKNCGVIGFASHRAGVRGQSDAVSFPFGPGVEGHSENGVGVSGDSNKNWGVVGTSQSKFGVGVAGIVSSGTGVYGESGSGNGVTGHSSSRAGVYGFSTSVDDNGDPTPNGVGVFGESPFGVGVYGSSNGGFAAQFDGAVIVNGDFTVVGAVKSAAVRHPDGSYRRLYAVESPESWFEDFGVGRLRRGKGKIKLDRGFAAVVGGGAQYHVFITPKGDSKGLYVGKQHREGFEVLEQQGGKSTLDFAYRVVAKRKDIEGVRLERVKVPKRFVREDLKTLTRHKHAVPEAVARPPRLKKSPSKTRRRAKKVAP